MDIESEFVTIDVLNSLIDLNSNTSLLGISSSGTSSRDTSAIDQLVEQVRPVNNENVQALRLTVEVALLENELAVRNETRPLLDQLRELLEDPTEENISQFNELRDDILSRTFTDENGENATIDPNGTLAAIDPNDPEGALSALDDFINDADTIIEQRTTQLEETTASLNSIQDAADLAGIYDVRGNVLALLNDFIPAGLIFDVLA